MKTTIGEAGVRLTGALLTLTGAGVANTGTLFAASNYTSQVGVKSYRIKRLKVANYAGVDTWLYIGTGLGAALFVQAMPRLRLVDNFNGDFAEDDLPEVNFSGDITCYVDNASVELQAEVEEIG